MLIKLFIFLIAFISGFFTISIFPSITFDDMSFFISELILNPIRFFIGMIAFITTVLAFSHIVRSLIKSRQSFAIDIILFLLFLLLMRFSVLLTFLLVAFSIAFGILTGQRNTRQDEGES